MSKTHQLKDSEYRLSRQDVKKVIHAATRFRSRCILKTFAQAAMRRFELTNLDIRDVDFERRFVHIREGRGGKGWAIPVSKDLLGDLHHLLGKRSSYLVIETSK